MAGSPTEDPTTTTAESLKEQGNAAIKTEEFAKAMLHYTHAIKLEPQNAVLYSNRALAFLKMKQFSLAMEDALQAIRLRPDWVKGYFRKGEIEFATHHYARAQESYEMAMSCQPIDPSLLLYVKKAENCWMQERKRDEQIPWLGSGIGIVIGVIILIADYLLTENPTHPLVMAFVTVAISLVGYVIAKLIRSMLKNQHKNLLDFGGRNEDLANQDEEEEDSKEQSKRTPKYSKSQARQRYKKGKM